MASPTPIEFHLPAVTSTNDYAKALLATYPYVFVSAMHQTAGRGRKGRTWLGDYGLNVYCSLALRHADRISVEDANAYMARGALAVIRTLRPLTDSIPFRIKYPNDVQANTPDGWKKIAGVLVEHEYQSDRCVTSIVGMGVNVQQEDFHDTISSVGTSLYLLGIHANVQTVLHGIKVAITELRMQRWQDVYEEWVQELDIVGKKVELAGEDGMWVINAILNDGRLVARNEQSSTERVISNGDTIRYHD